jgi:hypothetical protein
MWRKDPIAILARGAGRVVVVADGCIAELVAQGSEPAGADRYAASRPSAAIPPRGAATISAASIQMPFTAPAM